MFGIEVPVGNLIEFYSGFPFAGPQPGSAEKQLRSNYCFRPARAKIQRERCWTIADFFENTRKQCYWTSL